jgi:hypothetical protein
MKTKKGIFLTLGLFLITFASAQPISNYLIGNNAWYDGSVSTLWGFMSTAKFQTIRLGGATAESYVATSTKYLELVTGIKSSGAEPIVQVARYYTDQQIRDIVTNLNVTNGKNVKFWSIGNEPDNSNRPSTVEEVSAYIKRISSLLKSIDPTFIVLGPETAGFNSTTYVSRLLGGDLDITGKDQNGNYYIDVYTWHRYMFVDATGLETDVNTFLTKVAASNAIRPANKQIKWGITEFNTSYNNDLNTLGDDENVWSFRAGQTFAEIYGLGMRKGATFMNAWSMYEGQIERQGTDLSLFDKDKSGRSNYYHSLMLGQNMKKNYLVPTDNQTNVTVIPMSDETGVAVMILNKDKANGFDYSLRLNANTVTVSNKLNINVPAGFDKEIYGYISPATTQMVVFDATGTPVKRYIYTSLDADARRGPVVQTTFCNTPPSVTLVPQQTACIADGSFYVNAVGLSDGDKNTQQLGITATSLNPDIVSVESVTYTAFAKNVFILFQPKTSGIATVNLKIKELTNSCSPDSVTTSFKIVCYPAIPAKIEAESYLNMFGVQTQSTTDTGGGLNVGNIDTGDWMDYMIRVPKSTAYDISFRLASFPASGTAVFKLMNGSVSLATLNVQKTTGWQNWITQTSRVNLSAGDQTLRISVTTGGFNLNWINIADPQTAINETKSDENNIGIRQAGSDIIFDLNKISPIGTESVLRIFTSSGQLIESYAISNCNKSFIFNKSQLKSGVYIVNFKTNNSTVNQKFILN